MHDIQKQIEVIIRDKYDGTSPTQEELAVDITRLMDGEPIDYVIGWKPFLNMKIDLSYKPLIPRVETEYWVDSALEDIKRRFGDSTMRVLDLFCGSGCIGLAALSRLSNASVVFADSDERMGEQVARSATINGIDTLRFSFMTSDIFSNISGTYDVVFANPPYIPVSRKELLDASVVRFEPHSALFAEDGGLFFIKKFFMELPYYLSKEGVCFLEYDTGQEAAIEAFVQAHTPFTTEFFNDQYGKYRWGRIKYSQ